MEDIVRSFQRVVVKYGIREGMKHTEICTEIILRGGIRGMKSMKWVDGGCDGWVSRGKEWYMTCC